MYTSGANQVYENVDLFRKNKKEDNSYEGKAFYQGNRGSSWANKKRFKKEKW